MLTKAQVVYWSWSADESIVARGLQEPTLYSPSQQGSSLH